MSAAWGIGHVPAKRNKLTANKVALIYEDREITYRELNEGINQVADYLKKSGLKKGDRIAAILRNCPEFLETFFAAAKLGIIFVPLNFRLAGAEIEYQLNDSGSRLLVFHDAYSELINSILPNVRVEKDKFLCVSSKSKETAECPKWAKSYKDIMKDYSTQEPELEDLVNLDDPLAILYTSGATGNPKGAVVSHLQTFFKNFQIILYTDMRSDDVYLSQSPFFHSAGLFVVVNPIFCRGGTMVTRQNFKPEEFAEDIERYKPTIVQAMSSVWRFVIWSKKLNDVDVSSVRVVFGGGERTPSSMFKELGKAGIHMQQVFGQTENSLMMVLPKEDIERKTGSLGLPGFFTEVWIEDENRNKLGPGEVGEIVATGPNVISGYWNNPEKTAETIVDGVLHTGDLAYADDEGYFYFVDRLRDMYRSGGENVYPAEVEKILANHPKIANVAIIGVLDEKWGETGMAFIVPVKGSEINDKEIYGFLEGKIAKYKFPKHIKFLDQIPETASGKIRKIELREKYGRVMNNG